MYCELCRKRTPKRNPAELLRALRKAQRDKANLVTKMEEQKRTIEGLTARIHQLVDADKQGVECPQCKETAEASAGRGQRSVWVQLRCEHCGLNLMDMRNGR